MASIGRIEPYEEGVEDWPTYIERLESYMDANDIDDGKRVATLISVIGPKTYGLLKSLLAPAKPNTKSYQDLTRILSEHLSPKPLVIAERFRFYKRDQREGESIASYVAALKKLSTGCEFGTFLNDALRDRFVCGLKSDNIQKFLLAKEDLTFDKATKQATGMETAIRDAQELQHGAHTPVHKVQQQQPWKKKPSTPTHRQGHSKGQSRSQTKRPCFRCGGTNHRDHECRHINAICHYCNKKGHIESVCLSKQRAAKSSKPVKTVNATDTEDEVSLFTININHASSSKSEPIWVTPNVNNIPIRMELDTGAAVSLLPSNLYKQHFKDHHLKPTKAVLRTYSGEVITSKGILRVPVQYDKREETLDLYVVDLDGPPLLGRSWLHLINFNRIDKLSISDIMAKFPSVTKEGVGTLKDIKAHLTVQENAEPKFFKPRPVPYAITKKVEDALDRLESEGIIFKVDHSDWAAPIVPVPKSDGTMRICGDFKVTINPVLRMEQYPIPKIEDIFSNLAGGEKFSKIDLAQAYNQIELDEASKPYLTINTHKGLYRYARMPFGISTAPSIFQRAIEQVLQRVPGVQVYFDDILVTGKNDEEHMKTLEIVLQRLEKFGLRIRADKCKFLQPSVEYLGHVIDKHGLHKADAKVNAIIDAPRPADVAQLRSFLGMVQYYHKFIANLSTVVHPLNRLLGNQKWKWTAECEESFKQAKKLLSSTPVLTYYDTEKPLQLACDASPYGIGAVISHVMPNGNEQPVGFASRSLTAAEKNYSQLDKEALAIYFGVRHFYQYLYGREFTLVTDSKPLASILHPEKAIPPLAASRLQRWALFLSGFNYNVVCKKTKEHANADGLSRLPLHVTSGGSSGEDVFTINYLSNLPISSAIIATHTRRDPVLSVVYEKTLHGWGAYCTNKTILPFFHKRSELSIHQNCLMWGMRVIIPEQLQKAVLDELHEGHLGMVKMKQVARSYIWWPGLDKCVEEISRSCKSCAQTMAMPEKASVFPWQYPERPWQRIHIDFCQFEKYQILVIVDAYSKWTEAILMNTTTAAATIQALRDCFARYGLPDQVHSDNGPQFISEEFKEFLRNNGVKQSLSAPYHPATNGLAERFVQTLKHGLKAMDNSMDIQVKIARFLLAYRRAPHSTTNTSPAELFLGRQLKTRIDLMKPDLRETMLSKQTTPSIHREFGIGDVVLARNYSGKSRWERGVIMNKLGYRTYTVQMPNGVTWKRHLNQIRHTQIPEEPVHNEPVNIVPVPAPRPTPAPQVSESEASREPAVPEPVSESPAQVQESPVPPTPAPRRSGRTIKPPDRLNL
jgi:hypothetical protein